MHVHMYVVCNLSVCYGGLVCAVVFVLQCVISVVSSGLLLCVLW